MTAEEQAQFDNLTAERDALKGERDNLTAERDALKGERDNLTAERDALKGERDKIKAEYEEKFSKNPPDDKSQHEKDEKAVIDYFKSKF